MRIAHAVNLFGTDDPEHSLAQELTVQAMVDAKQYAARENLEVELVSVQAEGEACPVPSDFISTPNLERTIHDFCQIQSPPFPLIGDIFDRLFAASEADLLIYSNIDIIPQPYFYSFIARYMAAELENDGMKAVEIRRRTVYGNVQGKAISGETEITKDHLPLLLAERGESHLGFDCFVFHRSIYSGFVWKPVCIGSPMVGRAIMLNLIVAGGGCGSLRDVNLTQHLGDTQRWRGPLFEQLRDFNRQSIRKMYAALWKQHGGFPPYVDKLFGQPFFDGFSPPDCYVKRS